MLNAGKNTKISISSYLKNFREGRIVAYKHNRGKAGYASSTVADVRTDLHLPSLGRFVVSDLGSNGGALTLTDGHSRTYGLLQRDEDGNLTEQERNYQITVDLTPQKEFFKTFQKVNSGKQHTAMNDLENPDYFFGSVIQDLLDHMPESFLPAFALGSKKTNLAYMIYAYTHHPSTEKVPMSYFDVFSKRRFVKELQKTPATDKPFVVTESVKKNLISAMNFYAEYYNGLLQEASARGDLNVSKITKSGPFMAIVLMGQMRENPRYSKTKNLVDKTLRNIIPLSNIVPQITGSDRDSILVQEQNVLSTLNRKG